MCMPFHVPLFIAFNGKGYNMVKLGSSSNSTNLISII